MMSRAILSVVLVLAVVACSEDPSVEAAPPGLTLVKAGVPLKGYVPPATGERYVDRSPDDQVFFVEADGSYLAIGSSEECERLRGYVTGQTLAAIKPIADCMGAFREMEAELRAKQAESGDVRGTIQYCRKQYVPLSNEDIDRQYDELRRIKKEIQFESQERRQLKGQITDETIAFESNCLVEILFQRAELTMSEVIEWARERDYLDFQLPPHPGEPVRYGRYEQPSSRETAAAEMRRRERAK